MRILLLLACTAVAGCDAIPRPQFFMGMRPDVALPYEARLMSQDRAPEFAVTVEARGAGLDAVRESARFPATAHCLRTFGTSEIEWRMQGGDWAVASGPDGRLTVAGRCDPR